MLDYSQKLRIKTAMIVYELEQSLGEYVINNEHVNQIPDSAVASIITREQIKGNTITPTDLNLIIEASYLDEIFTLALKVTEGTSYETHMLELKQLCSLLGIFSIRNAVSHPNRPFPDSYWFRAASIASDPLIEKLNLTSVRNALSSAIEENLNTPPDEWLHDVYWAIPNTLPPIFDHEITGLLGREKEFKDLENVLSKERNNLIAIVAPGGIGKTSLVLQFLKDVSLSPEWSSKMNAILFCTLKNEKLTAEGVEILDAANGIEQVKDIIYEDLKKIYPSKSFSTFKDAISELEEERILLCIDNLETLLIDSQKEFIEFNQALPLKWRVLVTSRITVDSATTIPLEALGKRHAVNLSRSYLRKRGVLEFKQEDLERISEAGNNNPLAIRLTIDLYLKGGDITNSISKSQKEIASFSFKNLIESLDETSVIVLEAIYAVGIPGKSELMEFLKIAPEDLVESLNELAKTSLILRGTDDFGNDTYKLSDSIRDLLLSNPKNIEIRNKITEDIKRRKAKILDQANRIRQLGLTDFDEEYIPENIDQNIYITITDLNKALINSNDTNSNHSTLSELREKVANYIRYKPNDALLLFNYARIFRALRDISNEIVYLKKAELIDNDSAKIKLALGVRFFQNNDYQEALPYFEYLYDKNYNLIAKSTKRFSYTVTKLYLLCLLYLGKYDNLIDLTENWQNINSWSSVLGISRATALKRKLEFKHDKIEENTLLIKEALTILDSVFKTEGYFDAACVEANKIVKDLDFIVTESYGYSESLIMQYLTFVASHFFNFISKLRNENINSTANQNFVKKLYDFEIAKNPLKSVKWFKVSAIDMSQNYDQEHINELLKEGYEIVKVYHIPEDKGYAMSSFMFAENEKNQQFYLSVNNFELGWNGWGYIKENSLLAIKHTGISINNKPIPATEIVEIDQF